MGQYSRLLDLIKPGLLVRFLVIAAMTVAVAAAWSQDVSQATAEYLQRRGQLAPDDTAGRLELGIWCERNQLTWQAAYMYRQLLDIQPDHDEAYPRLVRITDTNPLPDEPGQIENLQLDFPSMKAHVTSHFVILYDTDESFARNRGALLEKAHDVFYSTFRRVDFRPLPLMERLVCILFADHDDYLAYAERTERSNVGWAAGYYSRLTNCIVFFDDRVSPQYDQVRRQMQELEQKADQQREQIRVASQEKNFAIVTQAQRELQMTTEELDWYRNRVEAMSQVGNAHKTVHEATHQLAFNSGLHRRDKAYPFWLAEGLATNFETDDPSKPFGPLQPNPTRRPGVIAMLNPGAPGLIPLEVLVSLLGPNAADAAELARQYDQSWALFGFVFRYYREDLRKYLDSLSRMRSADPTPDQLKDHFIKHFGQLEPLEAQFRNYLKRMP